MLGPLLCISKKEKSDDANKTSPMNYFCDRFLWLVIHALVSLSMFILWNCKNLLHCLMKISNEGLSCAFIAEQANHVKHMMQAPLRMDKIRVSELLPMTGAIVKDDMSAEEPIAVDILAVENDISTPFTKCHLDISCHRCIGSKSLCQGLLILTCRDAH